MTCMFEWEPKGVYWKYYGQVTGSDIIEASGAIYGDPRFDDMRYKLVDFLDVESIVMNEAEVARVAFQHNAAALSNPNIKNAIVFKPNETGNTLAKQFIAFLSDSPWEVQVFDDLEKASDWLGRKQLT